MSCRFVTSDVVEGKVTADEGYSIFEPTVAFEIEGKNVFHMLGIEGAKITVIMHFREQAIEKTVQMIHNLFDEEQASYKYWLLGTGFGFRLERNGRSLKVFLEVDSLGPTQGVSWPQTVYVGTISVTEWVDAVVSLSTKLSEIFRRLNPTIFGDPLVQRQETSVSQLREWSKSEP